MSVDLCCHVDYTFYRFWLSTKTSSYGFNQAYSYLLQLTRWNLSHAQDNYYNVLKEMLPFIKNVVIQISMAHSFICIENFHMVSVLMIIYILFLLSTV